MGTLPLPNKAKDPGELFLWSEPFTPILEVQPFSNPLGVRTTPAGRRKTFFLSFNLLGDFLATTPVVRAYRHHNPDDFIVFIVQNTDYCHVLDNNPDVDLVIYRDDLYLYGERLLSQAWLETLPVEVDEPCWLYRFNIHEVCRSRPNIFRDHISWGYAQYLAIPIDSVRPVVATTAEGRATAEKLAPEPYMVFCVQSVSKMIGDGGQLVTKDWVLERWLQLARNVTEWGYRVIAIGAATDPQVTSRHIENRYGLPIHVVMALLERATCVVTIEGGISHLCHGLDAPMVVLFSKYVEYSWAFPREATRCRVIYEDPRLITVQEVESAINSLLFETGHC